MVCSSPSRISAIILSGTAWNAASTSGGFGAPGPRARSRARLSWPRAHPTTGGRRTPQPGQASNRTSLLLTNTTVPAFSSLPCITAGKSAASDV